MDWNSDKWNYDPNRCDDSYWFGNCWWCKVSPDHDGELDDHEEGEDG